MGTLIKKIWWYRPNAYTTTFTLTATFGNGESEYVFQKTEESWEAIGTHDSRLVIILPNDTNGQRFLVRAYVEDPFVDLNATYANATSQSTAREVGLKRIVFDKTFFDTHTFEPNCDFENPFDLFNDSDLDDIYFTTITTHITLPDKIYDYGAWYGWGAYNETKPYSEMILNPDNKYIMPLSWIYSWKLTGYPTVGINDSTSSHPNIDKLVEAPMVDNKLYFVPLYHYENKQFDIDTHDYTPPTPPTPAVDYLYFEAVQVNSTVSMTSTLATAPNLEYSTDGETWQEWQHTTTTEDEMTTHTFDTLTLTAVGDKVYFRGDNPNGFSDIENEEFSFFSMTGKLAAHGNAQSLVDGDTPTLVAKTMPMFSDYMTEETPSDVLVSTPSLPATTLAEYCYYLMFGGCTGLTQAPSLPATTLAEYCYSGMFGGCTGLTQAPSIPATKLEEGCYENMFYGCTGLTQAPSLPATTLAEYCYGGMFSGCTGLTQAPSLPATTLAEGCYSEMFNGCTGLTKSPSLPATTLAEYCYSGMFNGCTFNMSDDGTTFNFQCGATLPQTVGEETFTTPAELANWMGNTNGFN